MLTMMWFRVADTMAAYQSNKLQKMLADAGISI